MKHRLMILGSLGEFTQLVHKAKEKGYDVIVCDGYENGPARQEADASYVIPVTEVDAIAKLCQEERVDGIITSFSDLLLECMVRIADKAKIPCYLRPEQLPWYRDKSICRETLKRLGLPTPGFVRAPVWAVREQKKEQLEALVQDLEYPLVSKPLDKYGSRGIFIIHDQEELLEKAKETASFTELDEILIEEYNDGYEFNMMTWVLEGQVQVISIADREKTTVEEGMLPISTRNVYPSCLLDEVCDSARDLLQAYIGETGQTEGALSMQFFWKPGKGIQVCEIAARFFGYEHELTDMVYGFNIEELLLAYVYEKDRIGKMFARHKLQDPVRHGAALYFQGRLLEIADQSTAVALGEEACVEKAWIFYREGERVVAYGPNPYLALYYISAKTREELDEITEHFFSSMRILSPDGLEVAYQNALGDERELQLEIPIGI